MNIIKIKRYKNKDLKKIFIFFKKFVYTKRTLNSWKKNKMTALIAYDGNAIVGLLPFEKVRIKFKNSFSNILWITSVFLLPEYRNNKLGTNMIEKSVNLYSKKFKYIFVMREDYGTKAYNWYKKNNFLNISKIVSLEVKLHKIEKCVNKYKVIKTYSEFKKYGFILLKIFNKHNLNCDGYKRRDKNFWYNLKYHFYNYRYKFSIIIVKENTDDLNYALVGKTNMKDNGVKDLNQEKERTSLLMVLGMKASGKMMKRMATR